ncbi:hypothetical protein Q3G72_003382 [Acer saccharum]|nr:hypothetical protein Q3G72_003382 [Acer saccharum]
MLTAASNGHEMDAKVPVAEGIPSSTCTANIASESPRTPSFTMGVKDINGSEAQACASACLAQVSTSTSSDVSHHYLRNPIQDQQHVYYASLTTLDPHTPDHCSCNYHQHNQSSFRSYDGD